MPIFIDVTRLKGNLVTSGLSQKDPGLFQVISQLIDAINQLQKAANEP